MKELIAHRFPDLLEEALLDLIEEKGVLKTVDYDTVIMDVGQTLKSIPLVMSGAIRILREDDDGNELFLYYLEKGDTCAVSLSCCFSNNVSSIKAIAEEDTEMIMIPAEYMDEWMLKFPSWKNFVMNTYQKRFNELLGTVDMIAFHQLDQRLISYLSEKARLGKTKTIQITHQQLAYELHSSREAISRLLKKLENSGKVVLGRNQVSLENL